MTHLALSAPERDATLARLGLLHECDGPMGLFEVDDERYAIVGGLARRCQMTRQAFAGDRIVTSRPAFLVQAGHHDLGIAG